MYKLLLISKYLRRKLAPLFAAVAVTICTAMVIIVASVMGGFLDLMQTTAKRLTPDVVIQSPSLTGLEDYEGLIAKLRDRPEVAVATAAIEYPATVTIGTSTAPVKVIGIEPSAYNRIVPYFETLMWDADDLLGGASGIVTAEERRLIESMYDLRAAGRTLQTPEGFGTFGMQAQGPAAVLGVAVNPYQYRLQDGSYAFDDSIANIPVMVPNKINPIKLALPIFSPAGDPIDAVQLRVPAVNEFKTGYFEIDKNVIFVPLDWLQKSLQMHAIDEFTAFDELTGEGGERVTRPARATHVYVKAAEDVTDAQLSRVCDRVLGVYRNERPGALVFAMTWEEVHGTLLGAVKNEKGMVTFLFVIISIVAIIMVATTFYMIVLEKTRDIGVLRAIGAPSTGVLSLFVSYGLAIGLIGAGLGVWLAWFTVTNLNHLQEALATRLATLIATVVLAGVFALIGSSVLAWCNRRRDFTLGAGLIAFLGAFVGLMAIAYYAFPVIDLPVISGYDSRIGWRMWDPQLYFFESIPDEVNWLEVRNIAIGAVVSSVLGAIIPAVIAARLNPVEALRYE
ncbi:MAG: ABC transporter permease [Phycisphaeraceae bacterium]